MTIVSPLAARMKAYEAQTGAMLPRKTWAVVRLDGKAFHTYTKDLDKPFDRRFMLDMADLTNFMCRKIQGAVFGYTQSDEISIVLTDLQSQANELWFGGKVQKIVSVAAGYASAYWNQLREDYNTDLAVFDARVFTLPLVEEVKNYLVWRQADAQRNAIFLAANSVYSHKELYGKSFSQKRQMLLDAGLSWEEDFTDREKLGESVVRVVYPTPVKYTHKQTGKVEQVIADRTTWTSRCDVEFRSNLYSPFFNFLKPEEPLWQMSEFLSWEPTQA